MHLWLVAYNNNNGKLPLALCPTCVVIFTSIHPVHDQSDLSKVAISYATFPLCCFCSQANGLFILHTRFHLIVILAKCKAKQSLYFCLEYTHKFKLLPACSKLIAAALINRLFMSTVSSFPILAFFSNTDTLSRTNSHSCHQALHDWDRDCKHTMQLCQLSLTTYPYNYYYADIVH